MATMRFSSTIARQMIYDVRTSNQYSTSPIGWTGRDYPFSNNQYAIFGYQAGTFSSSDAYSKLNIYKGIPETFPSFTDLSSRSSDLLISFSIPNFTSGAEYIGVVNQKIRWLVSKQLAVTQATASGTASWFILCRSSGTSMTTQGAMIGTVGVTGSGADLEIPDTNIVSGANYACGGIYLKFPLNWDIPG